MTDRAVEEVPDLATGRWGAPTEPEGDREPPDLGSLFAAGLTRRRLLQIATSLAVAWLAIAFLRQVGDVTAASARTDTLKAGNAALARQVTALEDELRLIQRQDYIVQQARAYRLGTSREIPFVVGQPAGPLGPDAPGSAQLRVGAEVAAGSPLEAWLSLLFGPAA
jgi:cell division protein FtsB